ncbi:MAG: hypothetical protein Q8Q65_01255 [bacterium]|nr:hypothetical protein [bacterium]
MTKTKDNIVLGITLVFLVIMLPLVLLVTQGRIDLRPRAGFGNATLSFSPATSNVSVGGETVITLRVDTGDKLLSGIDLSFLYNLDIMEIVEITPSSYFDTPLLIEKNLPTNASPYSAMQIILVRKTATTELTSGDMEIATIKVRGKSRGASPFVMRPKEIVAYNATGNDSLLTPQGNLETEVNVVETPPSGEEPIISFRVKLARTSFDKDLPNITTLLTVVDKSQDTPVAKQFEFVLQADSNHVYSPIRPTSELVGVTPGNRKTILLKGPKHIRIKVADQIELKPGVNPEFDWTAIAKQLPPGDLPDPDQDYRQNGAIDVRDIFLMKQRIGSKNTVDVIVADLNYDGVVLANDLDILFRSSATYYDDAN